MSGHNKWSKIKHKKAATDAQKSKLFGKLVKRIKVEAKKSGGNIESPGLKSAIEKAKDANMPKDNIKRAIKSAGDQNSLEQVMYEAYGPGGVAILIETITDNTNRTAAEIKNIFSKASLSLAQPGGASWAFTKDDSGWSPTQTVEVSKDDEKKLNSLLETLEDHEDVENTYTNAQ